jgi:hypothetical protein
LVIPLYTRKNGKGYGSQHNPAATPHVFADQNENTPPQVSVITIWIKDYFHSITPSSRNILENFPLPLIVNNSFNKLGGVPEAYPGFDVTQTDIYYGKWQSGLPTEILVYVNNPAVDGDYN